MKNIAVALAIIIALGLIGLWLLPDHIPSTRNLSFQESDTPDEVPKAPGPREDEEPTVSEPTDTLPPGSDAGMEFPISDDAGVDGGVVTYDALVTYTDEGFSPKNITVRQGDTVRFYNQSSQNMWVGADNHPTHTLYPIKSESDCRGSSFDQCDASGTGTFWEFTFTEIGTFGYHNHRRAPDTGSVTVE